MTSGKVAAVHIALEAGGQDFFVGQEMGPGRRIGAISALKGIQPPTWTIHGQNGAVLAVVSAGGRPYLVEYENEREPVGAKIPPDPAELD